MNYKDKKIYISNIGLLAFKAAVITGIIAHGYMLFNKLSYHDDIVCMFGLGATFSSGRWALGIIDEILYASIGRYSTPVFIGSVSITFIAMSAAMVCEILKIKSKLGAVYTGAVMASFPVVTSIFAFMFTAGAYFFALFLSVLAVYILSEHLNFKRCLSAACLIAFSVGIYQAFLASSVSLMMMILIVQVLDEPNKKFQVHLKRALTYAVTLAGGMGIYFIINKICLKLRDTELTSYQGINGHYDISKLPGKIIDAYHSFLGAGYEGINGQHFLSHSVKIVIILTFAGILLIVYKKRMDKLCKIWMLFLLIIFPLAVYLVKLYSTEENFSVHTLMIYSLVYVYILPVCILERTDDKAGGIAVQFGKYIMAVVLSMLMLIYVYYDNVAYLKMNFVQEQTISYFNTLITQIKSTEGYKDEYPVVFLGYQRIEDMNFFSSEEFSRIVFDGYESEQRDMVNNYANIAYLQYHLGYAPEILYKDKSEYWASKEVQKMNCYPDSGSIKVIDKTVIVKFAEYE